MTSSETVLTLSSDICHEVKQDGLMNSFSYSMFANVSHRKLCKAVALKQGHTFLLMNLMFLL